VQWAAWQKTELPKPSCTELPKQLKPTASKNQLKCQICRGQISPTRTLL
jgi:hypothetical protein